jgi:hypothetical protein
MSRVSGNVINASNFPPVREHPVYQFLVGSSTTDYGSRDFSRKERRNSAKLKKALDSRPKIRTRLTGPVGPELDWSIIYSDVAVDMIRGPISAGARSHGRYDIFPFLPASDPEYRKSCESTLALHRHIPTFAMQPEHIARWTQWARDHHVHYHGERGYKFGRESEYSSEFNRKLFRNLKKIKGVIPCHRRSEAAKICRAARRGARDCLIQTRPADRLFTTRYRLSASKTREAFWTYRSNGGTLGFQEYRSTVIGRGITLFPPRCHSVVPNIVFRALKRLYSRPVKVVNQRPWFKPDVDLAYTLSVSLPPNRRSSFLLKRGALIRTYRAEVDRPGLSSIYNSTIPRISRYDPLFEDQEWHPDPEFSEFFARTNRAFTLSTW